MHGLIHVVFRDFVVDTFGTQAWQQILAKAGIEDASTILEMKHYDDALTFTAVKIGAEVAGAPLDAALELFGKYFVDFAARSGFLKLLQSLGSNLHEFLGNLNILHHNVERDLPAAIFPLFEVGNLEKLKDGSYKFRVDYASSRPGLAPLLKGALTQATAKLFASDLEIDMETAQKTGNLEGTNKEAANELHWMLTVRPKPVETPSTTASSTASPAAKAQASFSFFDFHAALSSYWCCSCGTEEELMVTVSSKAVVLDPEDGNNDWQETVARTLAKKRVQIDDITRGKEPKEGVNRHLYFHLKPEDRICVGAILCRASSAEQVSSPWTAKELDETEFFWGAYTKLDNFYALSEDWLVPEKMTDGTVKYRKRGKMRFLSQSWGIPKEWDELMGAGTYAQAKAAEICCVAKDIAARELGSTSRWKEVYFWVDKCCIPQGDQELTGWCVNLLEEYIVFCDGLVVLVPWTYFTRLWCVYEWVCFLLVHSPMDIEICADPFVRDATLPLFIEAIGQFKLDNCQCFREADRPILYAKVKSYYKSVGHFESFLKLTAIALFARCTAQRRSGKAITALKPWRKLAAEQGFVELAEKIERMKELLPKWRDAAVRFATGTATHDVQTAVLKEVESFFEKQINPLIIAEREVAAHPEGLKQIQALRTAASKVCILDSGLEANGTNIIPKP